jgi:DNA-binding GntR family transcriptional regulator
LTELQVALRRKVVVTTSGRDHGIEYHRRIVEAVKRHDSALANSMMSEHLTSVAEDLRLAIEAP